MRQVTKKHHHVPARGQAQVPPEFSRDYARNSTFVPWEAADLNAYAKSQAGNAHKGRPQRQPDDSLCPDRLSDTWMGGEELTDDPKGAHRHPLCRNRTQSRRQRPRLGDCVVLCGELLRSADQGPEGIHLATGCSECGGRPDIKVRHGS